MVTWSGARGAALLLLAATLPGQQPEPARPDTGVRSPNGQLAIAVVLPAPGSGGLPRWSATFANRPLLTDGRLSLVAEGGAELLAGVRLARHERRARAERIGLPFGKAEHADDRCEELRLSLQRDGTPPVDVVLRCYDDALAFRYEVGAAAGYATLRLAGEGTTFAFAGEPVAWARYLEHFRTSHEHLVTKVPLAKIPAGQLLDTPLTLAWPDGTCASITEAALLRFAGLSLRADGQGGLGAALSPRDDGLAVVRSLPLVTPWRVVLVGDRPGVLLESNTLCCLNEPPAFDPAWIRPGKLTWPWWNGYRFGPERSEPILSVAANRQHIDWCAANGVAFHAVVADESDTPWYVQEKKGLFPGPGTDATAVRADLDLTAIRQYADAKGVRLWTWVHHAAVRGRTDAVFAALARHGFAGVMVDFLDRDDQGTVEFAEEVLVAAARYHVLVHFHGMYKPTGWQRTFPQLMNHEGSLNLEYLKWTDRCTPEHTLAVAFTRLVAGPMDYHLGGFRAVRRADFQPKNEAPNVLGTRGHMLAMYVCFDNPAPMVADYPDAYRDQPGFDFVRDVPTWWDATKVLDAEIGRLLVTARRRGAEWWLGALAAGEARELAVPLGFLGAGQHTVQLWRDGESAAQDPNDLVSGPRTVAAGHLLRVRVAAGGGFAARFVPSR